MKKLKLYVIGPMEQMKRCLLSVNNPERFAQLEKGADGINILIVAVNILLLALFNICGLSEVNLIKRILGWGISIILFIVYSWMVIRIGKGNVKIYAVINMVLYIHIIYILINASVSNRILHLIMYIVGHVYAIRLQIVLLNNLFRCYIERVRTIFYIEAGIILFGFLNQVMIYLGEQILYTSKILHYQLLG